MRKLVVGILAHVDAGKTTLSEALLYQSGALRRLGRVDHQDAFLDTDAMERERGITIFSKQAVFSLKDTEVTLLDTPGHVDFSAEAERTLQVLDCAILVISGTDGVQAHTRTLWRLLERYGVSYGALYRWKRMGLIPEDWFLRRATPTGQETFFHRAQICPRVEQILQRGDTSLEDLAEKLREPERQAPENWLIVTDRFTSRRFRLEELKSITLIVDGQAQELLPKQKGVHQK